ncbi:MAG TPA: NUDIX domain-containing protein [Acidimicrobiales bacterium]|nr:NUDIX domain-containing protein [Acidimicrobiales bacterium]
MSRDTGETSDGGDGWAGLADEVRSALRGHAPADARERAAVTRTLDELDRLPRPFHEEAGPVHVTGSAVIVGRRGTILHLHKRLHRWMQPGGHLDPDEAPWEAALRESQEETGLALRHPRGGPRLIHVDVHPAATGHTHLDLRYLLLAPDRDPAPPPGESPEARWYGWEEALALADPALVGALEVARRQPEAAAVHVPSAGAEAARTADGVGR